LYLIGAFDNTVTNTVNDEMIDVLSNACPESKDTESDKSHDVNKNSNLMNKSMNTSMNKSYDKYELERIESKESGDMWSENWIEKSLQLQNYENKSITYQEQQILALAVRYCCSKYGQYWRKLVDTMHNTGVMPIESDQEMLNKKLNLDCKLALIVKEEQLYCTDMMKKKDKIEEQLFIDSILLQKESEIKAKWLKKNALVLKRQNFKKMLTQQDSVNALNYNTHVNVNYDDDRTLDSDED
jgi:hypothetical protein